MTANQRVFSDPRVRALFEASEADWFLPPDESKKAAYAMAHTIVFDLGYSPDDAEAAWNRYMAEQKARAS